jgi:hypothetical protein
MKVLFKKSTKKIKNNLKLYKGIKYMKLTRIYPRTSIKSTISEVKVKIIPKKYKTPRSNELYIMKVYFSPVLLNELSWTKGNSIAVFKDDKNINNYFLKIAEDNRGFKIYNTKDVYYIQFTINNVVDKYKDLTTASFETVDNGLKITL